MAESATERVATSTVEDAGPCRKKVSIEIAAERVRERLSEAIDTASSQASLPGFRPGKAPRRLIERRFGKAAREEARQRLATDAIRESIDEHKLRVLGEPEGGDELAEADLSGDEPIRFTYEVEIAPEFDLPSLSGFEIKKPVIEVTQEMADAEIEKLRVNEGELEDAEGQPGPGDYLVGHGVMKRDRDGEVIHDIEGAVIRLPSDPKEKSGLALGVLFEEFTSAVAGKGVGDEIVLRTTGPDQHEVEAIRSEPITITFTVSGAHRIRPLEVAELVQRYGLENEQQLREAVMLRLNQRAIIEQQTAMRQQLARRLLDAIDFELPEKITARQTERNVERRRLDLMYRGVDAEEIDRQMDALRRSVASAAQQELKMFFILGKAAMDRETPVSEEEVMGRIAQIAAETGQPPDQLRKELARTGRIQALATQIREHKALDAMLQEVTIVETPLDEYNDWMRAQAEATPGAKAAEPKAKTATATRAKATGAKGKASGAAASKAKTSKAKTSKAKTSKAKPSKGKTSKARE